MKIAELRHALLRGYLVDDYFSSRGKGDIVALDDRIFYAVGRVCVAWSELERHTHHALHILANNGKPPYVYDSSQALIAGMRLQSQWALIGHFIGEPPAGDEEGQEWFKTWLKTAERLNLLRNKVVHSVWAMDGSSSDPSALAFDNHSRRAKTQPVWDEIPGGVDEVISIATQIEDHHMALSFWTSQQWRRLDPSMAGGSDHQPLRNSVVTKFNVEPANSDPS